MQRSETANAAELVPPNQPLMYPIGCLGKSPASVGRHKLCGQSGGKERIFQLFPRDRPNPNSILFDEEGLLRRQ